MSLPRANYDDVETIRQIFEDLRNLAMNLEGRELKIRRDKSVSPLRVGFVEANDKASESDEDNDDYVNEDIEMGSPDAENAEGDSEDESENGESDATA